MALYTSAAPTYFPSVDGYIDGGVFANNPSLCALAQCQDRRALPQPPPLTEVRPAVPWRGRGVDVYQGQSLDCGLGQWVKPLINILMDGVSGIADYPCQQLLGEHYQRLAPQFPPGVNYPLDEVKRVGELVKLAEGVPLGRTLSWLKGPWLQ